MKYLIFLLVIFCTFSCFDLKNQNLKKINYTIENAENILPKPIGVVNDFSHIFTQDERNNLEKYLLNFKKETSNEIVIVTMDSIKPYTNVKNIGTDLGNFWGIGSEDKNNGLIIVLSMNDREIGISSGTATEKVLTDDFLKSTLNKEIIPYFKEDKFYEGILNGLNIITNYWKIHSL